MPYCIYWVWHSTSLCWENVLFPLSMRSTLGALTAFGSQAMGAPRQVRGSSHPSRLLLQCTRVKSNKANVQGTALWLDNHMLDNTFGRSQPPAEMQPAEQGGWAVPAASPWWAQGHLNSHNHDQNCPSRSSAPQRRNLGFFTPVLAGGRNSPLFPAASSATQPCAPLPFPSPCSPSSTVVLCQDVTSRSRHGCSSSSAHPDPALRPLIPQCHHLHLALTQGVAMVIIDSQAKLWTPITTRQLAGSAGSSNAHGCITRGSELLRLFFLIDEWRIKSDTSWCLAFYVWMKPFLPVLIFRSHKSNKRPSCALLSTQPVCRQILSSYTDHSCLAAEGRDQGWSPWRS